MRNTLVIATIFIVFQRGSVAPGIHQRCQSVCRAKCEAMPSTFPAA